MADNGILVIAAEHDWSSWLRYDKALGDAYYGDSLLMSHLLAELERADVPYAAANARDVYGGVRPELVPRRISSIAIRKKPNTRMVVNSEVGETWVNPHNFKAVYYTKPTASNGPVAVIGSSHASTDE